MARLAHGILRGPIFGALSAATMIRLSKECT
jgi:hypothetical protein